MKRDSSSISSNLKYFRKLRGFTQQSLAYKVGIKRANLGAYEEGRAEPGLKTALALSRQLGVSLETLIEENKQLNELPVIGLA
jgi:transcriptional regulator with XRE-family HTH domain